MASIFDVTSPLTIRLPDGQQQLVAECFEHPDGLIYFDLWWHQTGPDAVHVLQGEITGDGPWKVGDYIFNVLGCQGTDPELASEWSAWSSHIISHVSDYPVPELLNAIATKMGAINLKIPERTEES